MVENYPFFETVKDILAKKDKNIEWLTEQIGRSKSWLYKVESVGDLPVDILMRVSKVLDFDFLADYYHHLSIQNPPKQNLVSDHDVTYDKIKEDEITVHVSLRGKPEHLTRVMKFIKEECTRFGYKVL